MDIEDILILVAAIIGWVYSNFRKLQKDAVERSRKLNVPTDNKPDEQLKPASVTMPVPKKQPLKTVIRNADRHTEVVIERVDETKQAEEFWKKIQNDVSGSSYINDDVDKKSNITGITAQSSDYINIVEEIHSGNVDWKKAIIYTEILRPVYF